MGYSTKTYVVENDTVNYKDNSTVKKGTVLVKGFIGKTPSGEERFTSGSNVVKFSDLRLQTAEDIVATQQVPDTKMPANGVINPSLPKSIGRDAEEIFYQKLGLKSAGGYDISLKAKGRALVLLVLIGGYFAYKKLNK
jgi:hypothetical protein